MNDDSQGCHDTITCADVAGVRAFLLGTRQGQFVEQTNALLLSPVGARDWPMWFYSRSLLFSVAARQGLVEPDLAPFSTVIPAQAGIQGY